MATGVFACMGTLVGEAVVVARYVGTDNTNALQAGVAMLFLFLGFYSFFLDGTQFSYIGEIFPTGLRAKGLSVGVATICLVNIIWLQAAPVGLRFSFLTVLKNILLTSADIFAGDFTSSLSARVQQGQSSCGFSSQILLVSHWRKCPLFSK